MDIVFDWECLHCGSSLFSLGSDYTIQCQGCSKVSPLTDAYPELIHVLGYVNTETTH